MSLSGHNNPRPRRVLIIDDEPVIRELLTEYLRSEGFDVIAVSTGEHGLAVAQGERFHAVLVDYGLPGMNGLECCRAIAKQQKDVLLALMTGWGHLDVADNDPAIARVIPKPFDLNTILNTLE